MLDHPYIGFKINHESNSGGADPMKALPISKHHHTREELEHLARNCKDAHWARRLRGIALAMSGLSRTEVARSQGVGLQTLRDWIQIYNMWGAEGLRPLLRGGSSCRLSEEVVTMIGRYVEAGPPRRTSSPSRWRLCDLAAMIREVFGVGYSLEGVRQLLQRLGLHWISPRPIHPRADPGAQEAFRRNFRSLVRDAAGKASGPIEIWFQDEARIGQMGTMRNLWARRGTRPRVVRDCRFKACVLFSAACPEHRSTAMHLCERSNTVEMNRHLEAISDAVRKGHHGVVVLDRATWHRSRELKVPANLSLLHLPPYSPELNPMENVYNYLKTNHHANRFFETLEDVKANVQQAWQALIDDPNRLTSIMHRKWAVAPQPENQ